MYPAWRRTAPALSRLDQAATIPALQATSGKSVSPNRMSRSEQSLRQRFDCRFDGRLERRASIRTHKGRSNLLNLRIVLSDNRFRFSGRCAKPQAIVIIDPEHLDAF
ncbi:hypothetical protein JET14_20045 [Martelella lutilitoris]|uniref:Uncharacterized protein n=1 Tax=Martelella lutilitoris TaxID=2583532 RepID=A0A7T7HJU6_9HYPH|nr:hypothetical protein [Martelella lutilitoris]QQM30511.1 hypothetical protein JET14_20045 [Martelella lutilitoris]